MIRHVVMWKFKEEAEGKTKAENMQIVRDSLFALLPIIPEIKLMEIDCDIMHTEMSYDMMLTTEFASVEEMKVYAEHPAHKKVQEFVKAVREARIVLDCER
ncbi:MAG: Dabb family protein [Clostridia bacterium]|nr:Dabb family protein [Butyricicoccus sp.]MBR7184139.1 Dabb family protein [Clostridia bacterium]